LSAAMRSPAGTLNGLWSSAMACTESDAEQAKAMRADLSMMRLSILTLEARLLWVWPAGYRNEWGREFR
jgi:hypothetical protein